MKQVIRIAVLVFSIAWFFGGEGYSVSAATVSEANCGSVYQGVCILPSNTDSIPTGSLAIGDCVNVSPSTPPGTKCYAPFKGNCASLGGTCAASCSGGKQGIGACTSPSSASLPNVCCAAPTSGSGNPSVGNPSGTGNPAPSSGTTTTTTTPGAIVFKNPLKFSTVQEVFGSLLGALQGIIVTLSLIFIVLGGIMYITSAGDDKRMSAAKGAITAAVIGLVIGIAAPSFLKEISLVLGWNDTASSVGNSLSLTEIALNVLNFLLSLVGILGLIMLVIGGFMYITAAGDEKRIDSAKDMVKYSVIGIAIALGAMVIVRQVASFFDGGGASFF